MNEATIINTISLRPWQGHIQEVGWAGGGGGGGVLGGQDPPFGGPPNFKKREKNIARMRHVLKVKSYPVPPPPILYPTLLMDGRNFYRTYCLSPAPQANK